MRRDVVQLRQFYATPLGRAARQMVGRKLHEAWGDARGLDVLGLGYATPYLDLFAQARRTTAAMPAAQGVEAWPREGRNLACLAEEAALPFANALFDRILVIHGLEEAEDPLAMLRDVWRVLAPSGRVIIAAASRLGLWSDAEQTPFGHGAPYSRGQLEALVREAELEPSGMVAGAVRPAGGLGRALGGGIRTDRLAPGAGGVGPDPAGSGQADLRGQAPCAHRARPARDGGVSAGAGRSFVRSRPGTLGARRRRPYLWSRPSRGARPPMKMIVAIIKPSRLDAALEAVTGAGASGLTVTEVRGYGRQKGKTEVYRGAEYEIKLLPKVKLEIAVGDDIADKVVEALAKAANTGKIGDGKVFVLDLLSALRIRTGEKDGQAIAG